jgi:hypothetical protein
MLFGSGSWSNLSVLVRVGLREGWRRRGVEWVDQVSLRDLFIFLRVLMRDRNKGLIVTSRYRDGLDRLGTHSA